MLLGVLLILCSYASEKCNTDLEKQSEEIQKISQEITEKVMCWRLCKPTHADVHRKVPTKNFHYCIQLRDDLEKDFMTRLCLHKIQKKTKLTFEIERLSSQTHRKQAWIHQLETFLPVLRALKMFGLDSSAQEGFLTMSLVTIASSFMISIAMHMNNLQKEGIIENLFGCIFLLWFPILLALGASTSWVSRSSEICCLQREIECLREKADFVEAHSLESQISPCIDFDERKYFFRTLKEDPYQMMIFRYFSYYGKFRCKTLKYIDFNL